MFRAWANYNLAYVWIKNYFVGTYPNVAFLQIAIIRLMDKQKFIALAGSQSELAKLLGISQAAVSQWKKIPTGRLYQLMVLRPDWFK
jgi:DNA invertase Pin-like site-specific DNA recombinase